MLVLVLFVSGCFADINKPDTIKPLKSTGSSPKTNLTQGKLNKKYYKLEKKTISQTPKEKFAPAKRLHKNPSKAPWAVNLNKKNKSPPFAKLIGPTERRSLKEAKLECKEIGFTPKTHDYAKCVMRLLN